MASRKLTDQERVERHVALLSAKELVKNALRPFHGIARGLVIDAALADLNLEPSEGVE
jgi:hypothetical protein